MGSYCVVLPGAYSGLELGARRRALTTRDRRLAAGGSPAFVQAWPSPVEQP